MQKERKRESSNVYQAANSMQSLKLKFKQKKNNNNNDDDINI